MKKEGKNMKTIFKGLIVTGMLVTGAFAQTFTSVKAASFYSQVNPTETSLPIDSNQTSTLEEILSSFLYFAYLYKSQIYDIV